MVDLNLPIMKWSGLYKGHAQQVNTTPSNFLQNDEAAESKKHKNIITK